jgi:hypothetical protein
MCEERKMERREFLGAGAAVAAMVVLDAAVVVASRPLEGLAVAVDGDAGVEPLRAAGARVLSIPGGAESAVAAGVCPLGVARTLGGAAGIYAYERARRRIDTVENLLLGTTMPIARTLSDVFRLEALLRREPARGLRVPERITGIRIAVGRGAVGTDRVAAGLSAIGATVTGVDLGEASRSAIERRVFRGGSHVLVLPTDRTDPELAEALAWYPVIRLPVGAMLVGASDDSRAVISVAASWEHHREA